MTETGVRLPRFNHANHKPGAPITRPARHHADGNGFGWQHGRQDDPAVGGGSAVLADGVAGAVEALIKIGAFAQMRLSQ